MRLESVIELAFFIISGAGRAVKLKPERRVLADIRPKEFREIAVRMPDPLEVEALIFDRTQREDRGGTPVVGLFDMCLQGLFRKWIGPKESGFGHDGDGF